MALAFPLDLRSSGIRLARVAFSLSRSIATAKLPAGMQVMETGVAVWRAQIQCRPEREYGRRRAAAFVHALSGAGSFLCYSPAECWPAAHPGGAIAGAWSDTLTVSSLSETTITAGPPDAALRLRAGDLVGLEGGGHYDLYRVVADATPLGAAITLQVAPRIAVSLFAGGATLRLHRPVCEMILDPTSEPDMGDGLSMAPVSFSAVQKVA